MHHAKMYTSLNICLFFFIMLCCFILEKSIIFKYTLYVYLFFVFWGLGWVIICEISKITVNFWQLAIFLTTLYMYLNLIILNSVEPEKNFKISNDLQYDYTVVAPGPQTHFKISVVFRIYHNVCNIRVQTIYTYKNLNNSGEK